MRFYGRANEISELNRLDKLSEEVSQFTVLMGRRRTGKTYSDVMIFFHNFALLNIYVNRELN